MRPCHPTLAVRAALACAVCVSIFAGHGPSQGQTRMRQAISGPVTPEAIFRGLSIVPEDSWVEVSVMLDIEFEFDSAELSSRALSDLDRVAEALRDGNLAGTPLTIEGHSDATGDEEYNRRLSRRRAAAVVAYLAQRGVAGSRLTAVGFGEERLLAEYESGDSRQRRVEIVRSR